MSLENDIRIKAMDLLARREHARAELLVKLLQRFSDQGEMISAVLDRLCEEGLLSDQRFAEACLRQGIAKGQGPVRLKQALRQQRVSDEIIAAAFSQADADWWQLAVEVVRRRFGEAAPETLKEKAKRVRFLQQRGFTFEQIQYALASMGD